ncbi:MAG: S9 family peptidase [Planctomycetaceae bacterium]|nr:S9 family peptidase [Planctomycetaceae bacterium]
MNRLLVAIVPIIILFSATVYAQPPSEITKSPGGPLTGTAMLDWDGDIVEKLIADADAFFLAETLETVKRQESFWNRDLSSVEAYEQSLEANRKELARILGVVDPRVGFEAPEIIDNLDRSGMVFETRDFSVFAIRWPVFDDYTAEGLLIAPKNGTPDEVVIRIPDADESAEDYAATICSFSPSGPRSDMTLIPATVSRTLNEFSAPYPNSRTAILTNREYLYRTSFQMGRHLIGYEVQQVLALVDWLQKDPKTQNLPLRIMGIGDGGMIALYTGALDNRIDEVTVAGYFDNRNHLWEEPIDRNVFGRMERFGDAQLAAMIFPRTLDIVTWDNETTKEIPRGRGGAIGKIIPPTRDSVIAEANLARSFVASLAEKTGKENWLQMQSMSHGVFPEKPRGLTVDENRERRMIDALDKHTQNLLYRSPLTRSLFMSKLDMSSLDAYEQSTKYYKDYLENEILGRFDKELLPLNIRSRQAYESDEIVGYEIVMDVYPGMFVYGLLFLPKELKPGEKHPTVVVQHGRNTRVEQLIENSGAGDMLRLEGILTRLARRGYITFAPQHLYMLEDEHRQIQRKAYPLKKTCFALMLSMQRQVVRWLATLPNVDMDRLAFYGHSYGGKSAMRLPPLIDEYKLVVISGDFGRYDVKMASTFYPPSFVFTDEYEMFEFDLGNTFNYSDLASLIAPRPFFIERGNFDVVGWDEEVGYEYGKVLHLYQALLDIPEQLGIDWFKGPHRVNAVKSFEFLDRFLKRE